MIELQCQCDTDKSKYCSCAEEISQDVDYEGEGCQKLRKNTKFILEGMQEVFNDLCRIVDCKIGTEVYFQ